MTALPDNIPNLPDALRLAAHGYRVLPIKPGQKFPAMPAWQTAATCDPATIEAWWSGLYRGHGVAIATGRWQDRWLIVVDVDEHGAASGHDTLHDLEATHGKLPTTVTALTGSGGQHIYLTAPYPIRNDAGRRMGAGIDIRGEGGQVLAPPTIHPNGQPYQWEDGCAPWDITPAPAPDWLLTLLTPPAPTPAPNPEPRQRDEFLGDSIADRYNASTTWADLLTRDGWVLSHTDRDNVKYWIRPGKDEGVSATTGWNGKDILKVFSTSIPWLADGAYSKFQYLAHRDHGGDMTATARAITGHTPTTPATAGDDEWGEPIPLIENQAVPPFPVDALPQWIIDHARGIADNLQVAIDLPCNLAIGALSVACLGRVNVRYDRINWTQPTNLYMAVAMPPSAGKSPAKNAMFGVLETIEQERIKNASHSIAEWEQMRRLDESRMRSLEADYIKKGDRNAKEEATQIAAALGIMQKPPTGKLMVDDVTTEALGVELADAGGNISVVSSEGGIFDRIAGLYNNQIANLDLYLHAWGGDKYSVSRIGRTPIHIPNANLSVITTVQPTTLDAIGARADFVGRGLTARFLLTMPPSNVGKRNRLRKADGNDQHRHTYDTTIATIYDETVRRGVVTISMCAEADEMFALWDQSLEDRQQSGGDLTELAENVGKLRASVLRVAALLHIAEGWHSDAIQPATMSRAITLGNYWLGHLQAVVGRWGTDGRVMQARHILEWAAQAVDNQFVVRDLYRALRRYFPDAEATRGPLELLMERGWIRPTFDGPLVFGRGKGRQSPGFVVHPSVTSWDTKDYIQVLDTENACSPSSHGVPSDLGVKNGHEGMKSLEAHRHVFESTSSLSKHENEHDPSDTSDTKDTNNQDDDLDLF